MNIPSLRLVFPLVLVLGATGCSTISGWFEDDEEDPKAPVELTEIEEQVRIDKLWSVSVGDGQGSGLYKIRPAMRGDTLYAAAADGSVRAINRESGKVLWKEELDTPLSGGVGLYENALFLGSGEGAVLKLDAGNGELLWSRQLQGEVLAAPQSDGTVVVAQTYDGKLQGLDFTSGEILWTYDSDVPVPRF